VPIKAKVYRLIVEPYLEQDLANMESNKARLIRHNNQEKVVKEEQIADINTPNRNELKDNVIELCIQHRPYPIIVKLENNTLDRTFIVDKRYDSRDPEAIWENVIYGYNQRGRAIFKLIFDKLLDMSVTNKSNSVFDEPQYRRIGVESLYAELDRRFGIQLSNEPNVYFRDPYRTTEEARTEEASSQPRNINTVLFDYIQEAARVIRKGDQSRVDYYDFLSRTLGGLAPLSISGVTINTEIPLASSRWEFR
jgi:hypothetical protein